MRIFRAVLLGSILVFCAYLPVYTQTKNQINDKEILAKLILIDFLDDTSGEDCKYVQNNSFLNDNLITSVNNNRKVKVILVDKVLPGFALYFFRSINVKKNNANIEFGRSWGGQGESSLSEVIYQYKCKKTRGTWNCEVTRIESKES
jgi:hypothetical protein